MFLFVLIYTSRELELHKTGHIFFPKYSKEIIGRGYYDRYCKSFVMNDFLCWNPDDVIVFLLHTNETCMDHNICKT